MLELVQDDVEDEGLHDAEWKEEVDPDDLALLLCDVLFDGVVEDDVIQGIEDVVDVDVNFEGGFCAVELWEDEVDGDKGEICVIELLEADVEVVDVLEDVVDVYEVGAPECSQ